MYYPNILNIVFYTSTPDTNRRGMAISSYYYRFILTKALIADNMKVSLVNDALNVEIEYRNHLVNMLLTHINICYKKIT
jgi:hypothetical protein